MYTWRRNLNRHMSLECGKVPALACPYCPYRSPHKQHLERHVNNRHNKTLM